MSSIQTGGYDAELFVSEIDKTFKCPICHDVMRNPVELACQHVYCKSCIVQVLNRNGQCPECRQGVKKSTNGDWIYDPPRRYFRNMHSELRLKCDLEGCEHITTIEVYQTHQSTCEFNPNRPVKCQKCKAEMCGFELDGHDCFQYLLAKVNMMEAASSKREVALAANMQAMQKSAQKTEAAFEKKIQGLETSAQKTNAKLETKIKEQQTLVDTTAKSDSKIKELETSAKQTKATLESKIVELEKSAQKTETAFKKKIEELEDTLLVSINCVRQSDLAQRTIIVKQSDTIQNVCDQFSNQLGNGDKFVQVRCSALNYYLDLNKTVKDYGIKTRYLLRFTKG